MPFGIHGLSYNTFASGFFTAGCFLGAAWAMTGRRGLLVGAGCAHGLAIFTYPTFVLPVACCFAVLYASTRGRVRCAHSRPVLVPAAAATSQPSRSSSTEASARSTTSSQQTSEFGDQGGGLGELADIVSFVWTSFTHKYVAAALLIAAAVARRLAAGRGSGYRCFSCRSLRCRRICARRRLRTST